MRRTAILWVVSVLCVAPAVHAQPASVESLPPVVVKTVPQSGDVAVDPGLKEISVTFSKDMMTTDMWSWVQITPELFPKLAGSVHFVGDKRTCVLPVHLESGRTYGIWVNSEHHHNFRDRGDKPAVPYLLVFQTRQ